MDNDRINQLKQSSQVAALALERAEKGDWHQVSREADEAEHIVVGMRDQLIELQRQGESSPELRSWLERMNTALSLIAGIEYPSSGLRRPIITQAREVLSEGFKDSQK